MKGLHGFTMIEVLVAMAVFAISAMAVLNATGQNVITLGVLEEKTLASIVANNQVSLLILDSETSNISEKSGSSEMGGRNWHWTIKPIDTSDGMLRAIDVIVWQDDRKLNPYLTVRTYVAGK